MTTTNAEMLSPLDIAMCPFWESDTMQGESVLFVQSEPGRPADAHLAFTPLAVPQLHSCLGTATYVHGTDFTWNKGSRTLVRTEGSRLPFLADQQLHPPRGSQKFGTCRDRECDLLFAEGVELLRHQCAVFYRHQRDGWQTPPSFRQHTHMPSLAARLRSGEGVKVVLLGDSISVGHNASGLCDVAPRNPGYGKLFADSLTRRFGAHVDFTNLSVSGMGSEWGIGQMDAAVAAKPDLLILAFGMNDASAHVPAPQFATNLQQCMDILHDRSPAAEFVLLSSMVGNPEWTGTDMAAYPVYRDTLLGLRRPGVAVADVTSVWLQLLNNKRYIDLSGNGLNHPNDFGHCVYAQVLNSTISDKSARRAM